MDLKTSSDLSMVRYITIGLVLVLPFAVSMCLYINKSAVINTDEHQSFIDITLKRLHGGVLQYQNETFHVIPNVVVPDGDETIPSDIDIVVCTQASLNNLHYVVTLANAWEGYLSVGVFSYDHDVTNVLHYIILLRICFVNVKRRVIFHLVLPISTQPLSFKNLKSMTYDCRDLTLIKIQFEERSWNHLHIRYPVNIMRNVAIMYSKSLYVFNIDIDLTPSNGMKKSMESFLKHEPGKVQTRAYIIPCFESNTTIKAIKSKPDLERHIENGYVQIREFDVGLIYHGATNYSRWLQLPYQDKMDIAYFVNYTHKFEPYFVAERKYLPMFDSRFKGYGSDRFSQICDMHMSGFDLAVMNNAFVIHDGFQDPKKKLFERIREQNLENRHFFLTAFMKEMESKYPFSPRAC